MDYLVGHTDSELDADILSRIQQVDKLSGEIKKWSIPFLMLLSGMSKPKRYMCRETIFLNIEKMKP